MAIAAERSEYLIHPDTASGVAFRARWQSIPWPRVEANCLANSSRSLSLGEKASQE